MKWMANALPHLIIAAYVTSLNIADFGLPGLRAVGLAGMLVMGFALYLARQQDGISPVGKAYLLYVIVNGIAYWIPLGSVPYFLSTNPTGVLYACLWTVTVVPAVIVKRYFTEYFARKTTPPAVWKTDIFRTINRNMTWAWAGIFAVCIVIALLPTLLLLQRNLLTTLVVQMILPMFLMVCVGVPFNKRYPAYYQRKVGIGPAPASINGREDTTAQPAAAANYEPARREVMSNRLTVVAVNGSPHAGIGNTSTMIQMMKPVLANEGIDLEEIFLAEKRIEYCAGCGVCMEKGKCWRQDDHAEIIGKVLGADGVILASPVYFKHVTAQTKAFVDRSLGYGHKPRTTWKPGMAISVSAGMGETATADYLAGILRVYGAYPIGTLTAIAVGPGAFMGTDIVEARARDLALDLARAIKEKRRYPATDNDLFFYLFMRDLVEREKDFMRDDFTHWKKSGFLGGFEAYINQTFAASPVNQELRKEWIRGLISKEVRRTKGRATETAQEPPQPRSVESCRDLLKRMPLGFKKDAAGGLNAIYQFEISGPEDFTAHLKIADGKCTHADGPHDKPDVIVRSPSDTWLAISRGEMDGRNAFMTGKYKVEGDLNLLLKLRSLFSSQSGGR